MAPRSREEIPSCGLSDVCTIAEKGTSLRSIASAKEKLDADLLLKTELVKVDCNFGKVVAQYGKANLKSVVKNERRQSRADMSILYALRHPACGACREKGKALANFVANDGKIAIATVVKDIGKTDKSLLTYYTKYGNRNPIYMDPEWGIYKAMGGRRVRFGTMARKIGGLMVRGMKNGVNPNITEVVKGDLWTQGGVLFFDRKGQLVYVIYEPEFGDELDMEEVAKGIEKARDRNNKYNATSSVGSIDVDTINPDDWEQ